MNFKNYKRMLGYIDGFLGARSIIAFLGFSLLVKRERYFACFASLSNLSSDQLLALFALGYCFLGPIDRTVDSYYPVLFLVALLRSQAPHFTGLMWLRGYRVSILRFTSFFLHLDGCFEICQIYVS